METPRKVKLITLRALRRLGWSKLRHSLHWLALAAIFIPLLTLYGSKIAKADNKEAASGTPISVANALTKDIPLYITALGSVTPTNTVTIRTQIDGQLLGVFFKEGELVRAGSKLAEIDPRPYEAQLIQYQGQLERDKALLSNAQRDLQRYKTLYKQDSTSQQILDTQAALVKQYEGVVQADQGQIDAVQLNLTYCNITAPIDGLAGFLQVDPGNNVMTTDANGIVIINSISPIYVVFSITEGDLPRVLNKYSSGSTIEVDAQDRDQNKLLARGSLAMIDNQIDPATGTIKLKAAFENKDSALFPNQFVNIRLLIDTLRAATVVPTAAVQYGVKGPFVYVLNSDQTVSIKNISILGNTDSETAIIGEVQPGRAVVIQGADKLKEGTKVSILENINQTGRKREPV